MEEGLTRIIEIRARLKMIYRRIGRGEFLLKIVLIFLTDTNVQLLSYVIFKKLFQRHSYSVAIGRRVLLYI